MSSPKTKQTTQLNINAKELRNIMSQYEYNLNDDDRSYAIKAAMNKLDKADKIIYAIYLEVGTKTATAQVLGISRISATRIIHNIEDRIKELTIKNIGKCT